MMQTVKMAIDTSRLEVLADVDDHVYGLYTDAEHDANQNLGYIDRGGDAITVEAGGRELELRQLASGLMQQLSSTGFLCWKSSAYLADWWDHGVLASAIGSDSVVVELGSGVGGILALTIGTRCRHFVATDQKPILKLLRQNIDENRKPAKPRAPVLEVSVVEFDWEYPEHGVHEVRQVELAQPDVILASDTIYNEFLVPHFVEALRQLMAPHTTAIVAVALRNPEVIECFVRQLLQRKLTVATVPWSELSPELQRGYAIYVIRI